MTKNFPSVLWQNSNLTIDQAIELLDLSDESHRLFEATRPSNFLPKFLLKLLGQSDEQIDYAKRPRWQFNLQDCQVPDADKYRYRAVINRKEYNLLRFFADQRRRKFLGIPLTFRNEFKGMIAQSETTKESYLIFRGTLLPSEWLNNFRFIQVPSSLNLLYGFSRMMKPCKELGEMNQSTPDIHRGFLDTYISENARQQSSIRKQIEGYLIKDKSIENNQLWVTGHSRGGALGMLATAFICKNKNINPNHISLCTMAQPRVGDENFAQFFQNTEMLETYRIVNSEDIVPVLPPASFVLAIAENIPLIGQLLKFIQDKLSRTTNFEHNGLPYYFSKQKGNLIDNHTIPIYKEALWESKLNQLLNNNHPNISVQSITMKTDNLTDRENANLEAFLKDNEELSKQFFKHRYLEGKFSNEKEFVIFPASFEAQSTIARKETIMIFPSDKEWEQTLIRLINVCV
ncbi:MAG: lipase family protein [Microcystaceae cyanobacterium]